MLSKALPASCVLAVEALVVAVQIAVAKREKVSITTFERWQKQFDRNYHRLWLRCEKDPSNRSLVLTLFCEVCRIYEDKIEQHTRPREVGSAWCNFNFQRKAMAKANNQPLADMKQNKR